MAITKRLRKHVEVEPRVYEAIRVYGESRAMPVSVALHELVIEGLERRRLSLPGVLEQLAQPEQSDGRA